MRTNIIVIDHIAFEASGYQAYVDNFRKRNVPFEKVERQAIELRQLYVVDPNGVEIELDIRGEL